jgi:uncharacterized protein (DUF2062 family)
MNFIQKIKETNFKQLLKDNLTNPNESDEVKALSIGFGFFMSIVPIWGFQLVTAIALSVVFKLNKALVVLAANLSLPPLIPFIIYLGVKMGAFWVGNKAQTLIFDDNLSLDTIKDNLVQYVLGSMTLAVIVGITGGFLAYLFIKVFKKR